MKKLFIVSLLILSLGLLYMGCDKDDGCDVPELPGTWMAIEEEADLSAYNSGKVTLSPAAPNFIALIVTLNEDGTNTYETWKGPDKTAEGAGYQTGTGTWEAKDGIFTLAGMATTYAGSYEQKCDLLIIHTTLTEDLLGTGMPLTFPTKITMQKQ